ncbi:MAG: amidohydrolase family protein [Microbacterium sp.]|uniref:amidohydrolase family protein n=1 Tax=Microbacterium sp. TaxID=51671 RepID=UPI0039E5954B
MRIDVHAHHMSPDYLALLMELKAFEEVPVFRLMKHQTLRTDWSPEQDRRHKDFSVRLPDMDAAGVDMQIISAGGGQPYFTTEAKAVRATQFLNDEYREILSQYPDRFSAFGSIPLPHADAAVSEIARCLDELGFAGIAVSCSAAGIPLDDERFAPVWAELDRRSAVLYVHPGAQIDGIVGCGDYHLAPDYVSPAEIAVTASRLVVNGILDRYPNVQIILATLGGGLPFFGQRFDHGLHQEHADLYEQLGGFTPHLRRFHYDTSVLEEPYALRLAAERFGTDRLMLGSDFPRDRVTESVAVAYVAEADFLTDAEKEEILDHNAYTLLRERLRSSASA